VRYDLLRSSARKVGNPLDTAAALAAYAAGAAWLGTRRLIEYKWRERDQFEMRVADKDDSKCKAHFYRRQVIEFSSFLYGRVWSKNCYLCATLSDSIFPYARAGVARPGEVIDELVIVLGQH